MTNAIPEPAPTVPQRAPIRRPLVPDKPPERQAPSKGPKPMRQHRPRLAGGREEPRPRGDMKEWPYDVEAVHGTSGYDDIIAWYLSQAPHISPANVSALERLFFKYTPGGTHTVQVWFDAEERHLSLCFSSYGEGSPCWINSRQAQAFFAELERSPSIARLFPDVATVTWAFDFKESA